MSARVLHSGRALIFIFTITIIQGEEFSCNKDGLYADFDSNCQNYVKCSNGAVTRLYSCPPGRAFSESEAACVSRQRQPCVRRICAPEDSLAYVSPSTACKHYYRCQNGTAENYSCPPGAWFDFERQACTRGAGTCYEPLCAGLTDGEYPDPTHDCRRMIQCSGAKVTAVITCSGNQCTEDMCPLPSSSIPLPAGDANFCSDETCASRCMQADDGAYADSSTGCREYFACEAKRVIRRGVCDPGFVFTGDKCEFSSDVYCPSPARSPCFNRQDGLYRDWRDCSSWFHCRRERVLVHGTCKTGFVFDSSSCVPSTSFTCEGPVESSECKRLPSGTYQDLGSNCTRYFHCEGALRMTFSCPRGMVFDGARCMPALEYLCPSLERDSCYGRPDGRYRAQDTGCRGYYSCVREDKAVYACAPGTVFDGESCVPRRPGLCPAEDYTCSGLADGYHPEHKSNCRRYFYCEGGDRLATFSCIGGKVYDGRACVEPSSYICEAPSDGPDETKPCQDGFYPQAHTQCKKYYFCIMGVRTYLTCPENQIFNGQLCVPLGLYNCPG